MQKKLQYYNCASIHVQNSQILIEKWWVFLLLVQNTTQFLNV